MRHEEIVTGCECKLERVLMRSLVSEKTLVPNSRYIEGEYAMFLKRSFVIALSVFITMFIAACGSSTTTGGNPYGAGSSSPVIQTATVTVKGQSEVVLTDAQGKTLYYYTLDPAMQSTCSSSCAQLWHPLLFTGSGEPSSSTPLAGKLSVQMDANGTQIEYNGHPLYTFSGDTAPGQTNGEGLFGMWFVVTPNLAVQGGGSTSGGYGY
jgi:predicted lipoprotein with Yx(FWY)xxD motif